MLCAVILSVQRAARRGITLAAHAPISWHCCGGFVVQVALQAVLNIAVVTNTIPNTGISLPFFSSGGTSLMMLLGEMGIVLSVSRGESWIVAVLPAAMGQQRRGNTGKHGQMTGQPRQRVAASVHF